MSERRQAQIRGVVQGVGFRPFVHRLATELGLSGHVGNDGHGVVVEIEGPTAACDAFAARLLDEAPPTATVHGVAWSPRSPGGDGGFTIRPSTMGPDHRVPVSPDLATCVECLAELWDPTDRRHRYPFVNCTRCGPRYTIVAAVPYDRARTTMAGFRMCARCAAEFSDPTDRRFHAQPVCCPACGPRLALVDRDGRAVADDAVTGAAELLGQGAVVAVKGLGGFHLAVAAGDAEAVARLRHRKHREEKPFAVMVADLGAARRLARVDRVEAALLTDRTAPIVLLHRRDGIPIAAGVAPATRWLGVLLAYTPVHHLLARAHPEPFVLTSGNRADEPIALDDHDARDRLGDVADAFLTHDRPIRARADDSVARVAGGRPTLLRRSRGHAPRPLPLPVPTPLPLLACGAELKHTFCLARDGDAVVSPHIGDLENWETHQAFVDGVTHLQGLFAIEPLVVAHDLHPEYLSTKYALGLTGVEHVGVQHHHAHVAACLADNGRQEPVIGVAFDGLGFGSDGTLWGGEVLAADLTGFERLGHLAPVPMPGGAAAIHEPWRMAAAHLDAVLGRRRSARTAVARRHADGWGPVLDAAAAGVNAPLTSGMGRLFDAVAAVAGLHDVVGFEGQAAMALEQAVDGDVTDADTVLIDDGAPFLLHGSDLVAAAAHAVEAGTPVGTVAARFHNGVVALVVEACALARERTGLPVVALSGGVFQNAVLVERVVPALTAAGFEVLTHRNVPPNDGGISFGQAAVAAARLHAGGR